MGKSMVSGWDVPNKNQSIEGCLPGPSDAASSTESKNQLLRQAQTSEDPPSEGVDRGEMLGAETFGILDMNSCMTILYNDI